MTEITVGKAVNSQVIHPSARLSIVSQSSVLNLFFFTVLFVVDIFCSLFIFYNVGQGVYDICHYFCCFFLCVFFFSIYFLSVLFLSSYVYSYHI